MKWFKNVIIALLITVFSLTTIVGCKDDNKTESTKGKYIEEDYNMVEGLNYLLDIEKLDNGKIAALGVLNENEDEDTFSPEIAKYYESSDCGKSWEEKELNLPDKKDDKLLSYGQGKILKDGSIIFLVNEYTQEEINKINEEMSKYNNDNDLEDSTELKEDDVEIYDESNNEIEYKSKLIKRDTEGNISEMSDDQIQIDYCGSIIENNGYIYIQQYEPSQVIKIDTEKWNVDKTIKMKGEYIDQIAILGDNIVANDYEKVLEYSAKDGKQKGENKVLSKKATANLRYYNGMNGKNLYLVGGDGVYSYTSGSDKIEEIIDPTLTTFGDNSYYLDKFIEIGENEFLATFHNSEDNAMVLKHYYYDSKKSNKRDNQITIYSIYEDSNIKQSIVKYQKEHTDVYIKYEIGIPYDGNEDDVISEEDAIKALNTKIMAGKGPDIICLDGLPQSSYIDKGLLLDITDIASGFDKETSLTNILNCGSVDGKTYYIPTSFEIPILFNGTDKNVNNLSELAAAANELKGNYKGDIVTPIEPEELLYYFYRTCGGELLNDDKSLNKEKLKEYLQDVKTIYEASKDNHTDVILKEHKELLKMYEEYKDEIGESFAKSMYSYNYFEYSLLNNKDGSPAFILGTISCNQDVVTNNRVSEKYPLYKYLAWQGISSKSIIPRGKIGISSKSKKQEVAKEFLKALFSKEYQESNPLMSLPIDKELLKKTLQDKDSLNGSMQYSDEDGETSFEVELAPLTDEEVNSFIQLVESYENDKEADFKIIDESIDDMTEYVIGKKNIDETLSTIDKKLKVYLSE